MPKRNIVKKETLPKRNLPTLRREEEYSPTPRPHDLCIAAIISWLHRSLLVQAWARPGAGHGLEPQAPTCSSPCLPPAKFTAPTPPKLQRLQDEWQLLQLLKRKASSKGALLLSSKRQRFPVHKDIPRPCQGNNVVEAGAPKPRHNNPADAIRRGAKL